MHQTNDLVIDEDAAYEMNRALIVAIKIAERKLKTYPFMMLSSRVENRYFSLPRQLFSADLTSLLNGIVAQPSPSDVELNDRALIAVFRCSGGYDMKKGWKFMYFNYPFNMHFVRSKFSRIIAIVD